MKRGILVKLKTRQVRVYENCYHPWDRKLSYDLQKGEVFLILDQELDDGFHTWTKILHPKGVGYYMNYFSEDELEIVL